MLVKFMLIFGTQMHIVTFCFIMLEFCMFVWQIARYFYRPNDRHRGWFILLLFLLLLYNIANGLFPDSRVHLPVTIQNMIAHGTCFLMASYFPFYFYKEFKLQAMRWHALFGVSLFFMLPYVLFFVILYTINGDLQKDMRYGVIAPFVYSVVLLRAILHAIREHYKSDRDDRFYVEELAVYCAVIPWAGMTAFAWFPVSQEVKALWANLGFLVITIMFFVKSAQRAMLDNLKKSEITIGGTSREFFQANCFHYGLTRMEILLIQQVYKGLSNREIADRMSISENTVKKHIQNAYGKTHVRNRSALIYKLQNHHY
jgi:DNA-binding CsgD family transcriptional regulator